MSATSGGGGSVSEGSDAGGSSQSTASVSDSPSTSFQTNLMSENVTKITLSEENSAGGYVADMTGSKINLALDERQQKDGIVNVAFDYEESANRGSSGGGEFRSANGSEKRDKVPEAVNLELVNMVPYSNGNGTGYGMPVNGIPGIPMKKDSEQVDISTPYDEYFVPVNEHKKYMRGEKLYVTKDKRRPTSWRRCLSWIIACTVISVVLIIAILAGTGVILSQEPDLVKDASVGRNFAGSNLKPSVTDKSSAPTAEKLMFVPRSIESEFVIDNLDFDPALRDLNSTAYQQFTSSMEDQLKMLLFDKETLEFGASDIGVKVVNISRDPFKVNYRIGWNYKQGVNNPPEPIKMEDVKRRLVESLARNQGYIDKYHIDREAIKVNHVINACQMENGGCSHICYYNYLTQLFTCTCPTHLVLDSTGKNCVAWSGSSEDDAVPIPSHVTYPGMPYDSTSNPVQELESTSDFQLGAHQNVHYHQESNSEQSKDSVYEGNGDQQDQDHERATEPKSKPTSNPYSNQEGKSRVNSEDISEPTPEPNVKEKQHEGFEHDIRFDNKNSQYEHGGKTFHTSRETSDSANASDSTAQSTLEGRYQDHAQSVYESKKPGLESASESARSKDNDFVVHPSHDSKDHEPAAEPTLEYNPERGVFNRVFDSMYDSKNHEPAAEPTPEPTPEPTAEQNAKDKVHVGHSMDEFKEHEPAAEPTPAPEPNANDKVYTGHHMDNFKDHEAAAEPTPEPTPEPTAELNAKDKVHVGHSIDEFKDHEPAAEPTPAPEPTAELNAKDKVYTGHSIDEFKDHEPAAEPTPAPEPTAELNAKDKVYTGHSIDEFKDHEPAAEPTPAPEPTAELNAKDKVQIGHAMDEFKDHEPAVEPTPEPTSEPSTELISKSLDSDQVLHSLYNIKTHELAAETTPEVNSGSTVHDHVLVSAHDSRNHQTAGKHTPEPTQEFAPELARGSTAELDHKGKDHSLHSAFESKDREPEMESASGFGHQDHGDYSFKHDESLAKPTTELDIKDQEKVYGTHFMHETKDLGETTTLYTLTDGNQAAERAPKPTSEPSDKDDHLTRSSNTESSEHLGTTIHVLPSQDNINLGPNYSLNISKHLPVSHEEHMQVSNFKPGYSEGTYPDGQSESDKGSKSGHQVPYLQDIIARVPYSDSGSKNATTHGQKVLQNVEFSENGEPIIEEILIDKSQKKGQDETSSPTMISNSHSDLNRSSPVIDKNSPDLKSVVLGSSNNNYQNKSVFMIAQSDDTSQTKTVPHEITENATGGPVSADRSTVQQSTIDGNEAKNGQFEYTQIPTRNRESEETISNQKPTQDFTEGANDFGGTPLNLTKGIDQEEKSVNLPRDKVHDSTVQPQLHDEYHTIPVGIEFSNSPESNININGKPKHDSSVEPYELHSTTKVNAGLGEESTESVLNSNGDLIFRGAGSDQTKSQKITTESHIATTMLFSVLSPDAIEQGKTDVPLNNETGKGIVPKETVLHTKTGNKQSSPNSNETIKSPEELTNNIKDELIDNEEFNTLLGKEQKKESGSGDAKELVNKYANKSQKVDKKKLKDYVKNEKTDSDKKTEVTARPAVTPEDFILQKHVNGNENVFDLDYSLQNEHTTKQDGGVTVIDPNEFDAVPGVSFKPQGINNHDLRVLQTVAPDSTLETGQTHDLETLKSDSKVKLPDNKEGDKQEKDYTKFDKDYKYEKQKVSKKKDLKKKGGNGKDGKNVEIDDGRKYFTETSKENIETSHEIFKDNPEIMTSFEKITVQPEPGVRLISDSVHETATTSEHTGKIETPFRPSYTNTLEKRTEVAENVTEYTGRTKSITEEIGTTEFGKSAVQFQGSEQPGTSMDQNYHQMINESSVKTTFSTSPGIIYDGQSRASVSTTESRTTDFSGPLTETENIGLIGGKSKMTFETVLDGIPEGTTRQSSNSGPGFKTNGTMVYETRYSTSAIPRIEMNEGGVTNTTTTANPTIIIHGQSGSLQNGHFLRFANATSQNPGNTTVISILNGALNHSDGQVFTFKNYTTTFPNGSVVRPTIIVRGQSGALQGGHEVRFGNGTTFVTSLGNGQQGFKNSTVFRIENGSLPGTVFDGHFNPLNGHYHMFSNSSGTFVYSNVTAQPTFIIKGESGDFGNSRVYVMANDSGNAFSGGFTGPSVIFRNSTVFAVGNAAEGGSQRVGIQEITTQPHDVNLNETIHYTRQMSPNFFSTGTAYKVNNYFGYISKCAAGQFQCVNGTSKRGSACISLSSKCDSISDCSDGSDELGCIENGCPGNFQCSDGSCLKRHLVCNGILDCSDGSDEKQCESWKCEFDEFQCPSGRCIPVVWQCDGKPDCDNHTDEYNCQTSCGNDEYLCPEGWCVPLTYKCNGVKECSMGEDEQLCDCSHEEFKCQTGGCVSMKQICDGLDDCPDRSDEWDCVKVEKDSNLLKIRFGPGDFEPVCADGWTHRNSEEVCTSLGYYSSVPMENENSSSITTEKSFFILKNDSTDNFNKRVIVNLKKSEGNCSSGRLVAISCQEFSCGSRSMTDSSSVEARLVGGMSATAGQWPSVALLYNIRNFHSCTANVLTPRWALASYNCLKMGNKNLNEQDWKFFGGSTVFEAERENAETRKIVSIIPHPQVKFNQFLFSNDLALVELDQSLQFNSNLGAVCLPEQEIQPRQICVTAGWGMNTPEDKFIRQQLQYLPVPTMNLTECNSTEHYSGFITDDKICAGYNSAQKSLCYNEEGAPLMCVNERGEWELQGVMSYHSNCGRGSHPSIFSSITPVADWIKKTIGNNFERKTVTVARR